MVVFPNCKINLGLNILNKREDGYHNLETVFYPLPLNDVLEVIRASSPDFDGDNAVQFSVSGLSIDGNPANNLCIKAFHLLKKDFPQLAAIQIYLHKVIPMGAGLGGGSADGAHALILLNNLFHLGLTEEQLIIYGLQLGSDCPFFILNKPCFATGRGEVMKSINLDLSAYKFIIINPAIHIGTKWAFSNITPKQPTVSIETIIQQPIHLWKDCLINDFELPAIQEYPEIGAIKESLYQQGAVYSSMTGSGSTVFGIFEKEKDIELSFPKEYFTYTTA